MKAWDVFKNAQLVIYHCAHCNYWHLGRSRHQMNVQARLDQLLGPYEPPRMSADSSPELSGNNADTNRY